MVWVIVWTSLVLGTLVGAFVLGRDLWRKGRALLAELARAGEVLGAHVEAPAPAVAAPIRGGLLTDRAGHRARVAQLRAARAVRREARQVRHERTVLGWRAYTR